MKQFVIIEIKVWNCAQKQKISRNRIVSVNKKPPKQEVFTGFIIKMCLSYDASELFRFYTADGA